MSRSYPIRREEQSAGGRYVVTVDGHEAELTYSRAADRLILNHTRVPKPLSGRGVGQALVERAVEDARAAGIRIVPLCSFAKAQIERRRDWQDVVA